MALGRQRNQKIKLRSDPEGQILTQGFAGGLNTLVAPSHLADNECSILRNAQLSEDGVVTRRDGTTYFDSAEDGDKVYGLFPFTTYDDDGVRTTTLFKVDESGNLKKWTGTVWETVTGFTYTAGVNCSFCQGRTKDGDFFYIGNGVDPLTKCDGSTITVFNEVTNPSGGLSISVKGSAGTSSYSYEYTLVTKYGETEPCSAVNVTTGNAKLSTTNYNELTITRSTDANVTGYNVYGRKSTLLFFLAFVPQSASGNPVYNDDGSATPNDYFGPPSQNSTAGIIGSILIAYHDTLFIGGVPSAPSRVYYSSGVDLFDDFQIVNGGGSIVINREDGDNVTAMVVFKDKVVIFKNRSSYLFQFNTPPSLPTIAVVNPEIGCVASRSACVVLNDVYFFGVGGTGVFTLGYQSGYFGVGQADMLRTNEVSVKIHPTIAGSNKARIVYASAIHSASNYKYLLSVATGGSTYNDTIFVFDTRYNAWAVWDNINANCFTNYIDANGVENILVGSDIEGRVNKLFTGTSDNGANFSFQVRTKDFNAKAFHLLKTWIWPTFHFRNILGSVKVTIITDGATTQDSVSISSTTSYTGWSFDRWANFLWGETAGSSASATSADAPRQKNIRIDARSIMFLFENTSASDSISLLGVQCKYIMRTSRRLPSQYIIS